MVAGKFVFDKEVKAFADTSKERNVVAASTHADNIYTAPPRISYKSPFAGTKLNSLSSQTVGVVPPVFPTMKRSSVFQETFPITLIL